MKSGHWAEHGHHYDVFIDVRRAIDGSDRLGQMFRLLLQSRVATGVDLILYPEESELAGALAAVRLTRGHRPLEVRALRRLPDGRFRWRDHSASDPAPNLRILLLDEGVYSGSALIAMLDLAYTLSPQSVQVVVLEKRYSSPSRREEIERLARLEPKPSFHCLVEIDAPCWPAGFCPYCNAGQPLELLRIHAYDSPLAIPGMELGTNAEFTLWLLSGLYGPRTTAEARIKRLVSQRNTPGDVLRLAARLLVIHGGCVASHNLLDLAELVLREAMLLSAREERARLLALCGAAPSPSRLAFLSTAIQVCADDVVRPEVFAAAHAAVDRAGLNLELRQLLTARYLSEAARKRWNYLLASPDAENDLSDAIMQINAITMVHRGPRHEKLADKLVARGLDDPSIRQELELLLKLLRRLPETTTTATLIQILADSLKRNRAAELAGWMGDEANVKSLVFAYCMKADEVVRNIAKAVGDPDPEASSKKCWWNGSGLRTMTPLICLQDMHLDILLGHLSANQDYGACRVSVQWNPDDAARRFSVVCTSESTFNGDDLGSARRSAALASANSILRAVGMRIEYAVANDSRFLTVLNMRLVDHVEVSHSGL